MPELKTNSALLEALKSAARGQPTRDELREQRISFILGSLDGDKTVTRDRVIKVLESQQGRGNE